MTSSEGDDRRGRRWSPETFSSELAREAGEFTDATGLIDAVASAESLPVPSTIVELARRVASAAVAAARFPATEEAEATVFGCAALGYLIARRAVGGDVPGSSRPEVRLDPMTVIRLVDPLDLGQFERALGAVAPHLIDRVVGRSDHRAELLRVGRGAMRVGLGIGFAEASLTANGEMDA